MIQGMARRVERTFLPILIRSMSVRGTTSTGKAASTEALSTSRASSGQLFFAERCGPTTARKTVERNRPTAPRSAGWRGGRRAS